MVESHSLSAEVVRRVTRYLIEMGFDFMVHAPVPENHTFEYWEQNEHNPDFPAQAPIQRGILPSVESRLSEAQPGFAIPGGLSQRSGSLAHP